MDVEGLRPATSYNITVFGFSEFGDQIVESTPTYLTTVTALSPPYILTSEKYLTGFAQVCGRQVHVGTRLFSDWPWYNGGARKDNRNPAKSGFNEIRSVCPLVCSNFSAKP